MRFFSVYSLQPIGKSESAEFLFCPNCQTERTIEFRSERLYGSLFRIPIIPVREPYEICRCLTCRTPFKLNEIREAQKAASEDQLKCLTLVAAGIVDYLEWTDESILQEMISLCERNQLGLRRDNLEMVLNEHPWHQTEPLIWISRQSDRLDSGSREKLFQVICQLIDGQNNRQSIDSLPLIGSTIGLGDRDIERVLERFKS